MEPHEDPNPLHLLYTADNVPEAELLTQVLTQAGFHVEYVPPVTTGIFGTTGSNLIYVHADEAEAAAAFLNEYLHAPPPAE